VPFGLSASRVASNLNGRCRNCQNPPRRGSNFAAPFPFNTGGDDQGSKQMQRAIRVSLVAGVSALTLAAVGLQGAKAADMGVPYYQAPPPAAYAPPPVQETYVYPPPPPAYVYPPPPVVYYYDAPPPYEVLPKAYYVPGGYWRHEPRFAYGYGHWGHRWHR
jgi:hypothetical protein